MKSHANGLSRTLVCLIACSSAQAVMASDSPPSPQPAATDPTAVHSAVVPPLVTRNPDGTLTVQKVPRKRGARGHKKNGLTIPPQVVAPIAPVQEKRD